MSDFKITQDMWQKVAKETKDSEKVVRPSLTYMQDVWRRLKGNKPAMVGLIIIVLLVLGAIFIPFFYPLSYSDQDLNFTNLPPRLELYKVDEENYIYSTNDNVLILVNKNGELVSEANLVDEDRAARKNIYDVNGHEIVMDYSFGLKNAKAIKKLERKQKKHPEKDYTAEIKELQDQPKFVITNDGNTMEISKKVRNKTYIWGSDSLGRDLFIRVVYGARISLTIGFVAAIVNFIIGVLYGTIAGYFGGLVDEIMMRIVDIISTVPMMLIVILIMVRMGPGIVTIIIALGLTYWVRMARIVRGQVLQLKEQEYVLAAQSLGAFLPRIMMKHLIPNAMGPIMVALTMQIPSAIFTEAFLSFMGLGVSAPMASWGTLANEALGGIYSYPYQLLYPALAISVTLFAFNLLGDGLRDALDPKLRK